MYNHRYLHQSEEKDNSLMGYNHISSPAELVQPIHQQLPTQSKGRLFCDCLNTQKGSLGSQGRDKKVVITQCQ